MLIKIITRHNETINNQFCQIKIEHEFIKTLKSSGHEIVDIIYKDHSTSHGLDFSKQESKNKASTRAANWDNYFTEKRKQKNESRTINQNFERQTVKK